MAGDSIGDSPCLSDRALQDLLDGNVSASQAETHLDVCSQCQCRLEALSGNLAVGDLRETPRETSSEALASAMQELREHPLEVKRDLESWLTSVGALDRTGELLGVLDGYELKRVIAEGGMGLVLEARDPRLDRAVAIKLIRPALVGGSANRKRLLLEARAVARIQHDHVIPIYAAELTSTGGIPFIVMPLVPGGSLQDSLDKEGGHPLPLDRVVSVGEQMADALSAAHSANLVHCDIKPANVLLRDEGQIWLADFGIARALDDIGGGEAKEISGTPQYMAPEQFKGQSSDQRTDLFSLGAVLYAMATGKPPFDNNDRRRYVPSLDVNPSLPAWLGKLIDALLEEDPDRRPQTADEVHGMLLAQRQRKPLKRMLGVLVGVTLIVSMATLWVGQQSAWKSAPFLLPQQGLGFHSLPEAIEAADPGTIIEIQQSGLVYHGLLPVIDKPLGLRAIGSATPRIEGVMGMQPLLKATAPLRLEGIHFSIDCGDDRTDQTVSESTITPPLIEALAPVLVCNCIFAVRRLEDVPSRMQASLVLLDHVGNASFHNSVFINRSSSSISMGGDGTDITLDNCFMLSLTSLFPRKGEAEQTTIRASRSSFHTRELVLWRERHQLKPFDLTVTDSVIDVEASIFLLPGRNLSMLPAKIQFDGERNLYDSASSVYLALRPPTRVIKQPEAGRDLRSLERWHEFWKLSDTESYAMAMELAASHQELLHTDVLAGLEKDLSVSSEVGNRGIDKAVLGPGSAYKRFRESEAYERWDEASHLFGPW